MRAAKTLGMAVLLSGLLALSGCSALGGSQPTQDTAEQQMSPIANGTPAGAASPSAAAKPSGSPAAGTKTPIQPVTGSPTPGQANVDVAPAEATSGNVVLTLSFDNARHMFEQTTTTASAAPNPDPAQTPSGDQAKAADKGSAVFSGGMLRVIGNFDPSQGAPADAPNAILRHVVLVVKAKDGGQALPYQSVTIDVLLDGRPIIFDQALVPMVAVDKEPRQVYYGNNIKFPQRGTYQVFVRMQRNPLLGNDAPPAAQFNVTVK
jgi:hypothetical protein